MGRSSPAEQILEGYNSQAHALKHKFGYAKTRISGSISQISIIFADSGSYVMYLYICRCLKLVYSTTKRGIIQ